MTPTWHRLGRGRVWHLDAPGAPTLRPWCGRQGVVAEVQSDSHLPPKGGRPCPECVRLVDELRDVVGMAQRRGELHIAGALPAVPEEVEELVVGPATDSDGGVVLVDGRHPDADNPPF